MIFVYTNIRILAFHLFLPRGVFFFSLLNGLAQPQTPFSSSCCRWWGRVQEAFAELKCSCCIYIRHKAYQRGTVFELQQSCWVILSIKCVRLIIPTFLIVGLTDKDSVNALVHGPPVCVWDELIIPYKHSWQEIVSTWKITKKYLFGVV